MAKLNTKTSIVDKLKSEGKDSSFSARSKLYTGSDKYTGSASQNKSLLSGSKTSSSSSIRNKEKKTTSDFNDAKNSRDDGVDALSKAQDKADARLERLLKAQLKSTKRELESERTSRVSEAQTRQAGETASTQKNLVRIGGYLGETGSGGAAVAAQNNLHAEEIFEINNKIDGLISEAEDAYRDKNFEAMQAALDRKKELEEFAYKKEQDLIDNNLRQLQVENQASQFEQSQALKWSQFNLAKDKFEFDKSSKGESPISFRSTVDFQNAFKFVQESELHMEAAELLEIEDDSSATDFIMTVKDLVDAGAKEEELYSIFTSGMSDSSAKKIKALIKDLINT